MKIGGVTCFYNDYNKIARFEQFYNEYRNELAFHIIVDNGSNNDFRELLKEKCDDRSVIIFLDKNMGTTGAYNAAFRYLLENTACDAFMIIANDIRLDKNSVTVLYNLLFSDSETGVTGPVLLKKAGSLELEEFGGKINPDTILVDKCYFNKYLNFNIPEFLEVDFIAGGINMAKREVYEKTGLQDKRLFMYGDEVDWDIRVRKAGYKLIVTKNAIAWHEHINSVNFDNNYRDPLYYFYFFRNRVILSKKYGTRKGFWKVIYDTDDYLRANGIKMIKDRKFKEFFAIHLAVLTGILGLKLNLF